MSTSQSRLDLTGQASEDEPASQALHREASSPGAGTTASHKDTQPQSHGKPSQSQQTTVAAQRQVSRNTNGNEDGNERRRGMLTRYVPNPIDLWHSRSPTSLLLLPFVFAIYVVLQIPLHYGSDTEDETWRGRAKDVDKLSADLKVVEHDMHEVKEDQLEIKGEVASLRRRLNKMKQRREERAQGRFFREEERRREEAEIKELWKKQEQLQEAREREREYQLQQEQQGGASGKEGPIASVAMVKAMAVATFAGGQQANVDDAKKAD